MGKSVIGQEEVVGGDIAVSMSDQIALRVDSIRRIKAEIEERRIEAKIDEREADIESIRTELLDLTRSYHELTGQNYEDEAGFARYRSEGQSHRYDHETVDEVLAALLSLQGDMLKLADDKAPLVNIGGSLTKVADIVEGVASNVGDPALLIDAINALMEQRAEQARELNLRLGAMQHELVKLAAARKVSAVAEGVAIR
jgi:hypothetical protein